MANNHHSLQIPEKRLKISVDYREKTSGIVELLNRSGFIVRVKKLPACDYIIGNEIGIERKTAKDFIISIIDGRLFTQAASMKRAIPRPVFILEGNPFTANRNIDRAAIQGAMVSIQVIWHIPIVHSKSLKHTCQLMGWMGQQFVKLSDGISPRSGHRPKRQLSKQLYVLQGLPNVGPTLSKKLLGHFKSVRNVMTANEKKLLQVDGIGPKKVKAIQKVLE